MHPVREMLAARGLSNPDGRALYGYRCSEQEYQRARDAFAQAVRTRGSLGSLDGLDIAAFCLFAAEWWRRHHEGGSWAWWKVFEAAHLSRPQAMQPLYTIVRRGLAFWGRRVLQAGDEHAYLVTLACEGGLPLQLLRRDDGNRLRRYFRAVLEEFYFFRARRDAPEVLAARPGDFLPQQFRRPEVFFLCGQLVEAIWSLQQQIPEGVEPLSALDHADPTWRARLPLHLEDELAQRFLRGLVTETVEVHRRLGAALRVENRLAPTDDGWRLLRTVRFPGELDAQALSDLAGFDSSLLPARLQLLVAVGDQPPRLAVYGIACAGQGASASYLLEGPGRTGIHIEGPEVEGDVCLVLSSQNRQLARVVLPGGAELRELPWVLDPPEDPPGEPRWIGVGTVQTRTPVVWVVAPRSAEVKLLDGGSVASVPGALPGEREIFRLQGAAQLLLDEETFEVRSGQPSEDTHEFRWEGRPLPLVSGSATVYCGTPRLTAVKPHGLRTFVAASELSWRPAEGAGPWRPWGSGCLGDVRVRAAGHGVVLYRGRIVVLPEHCALRYGAAEVLLEGLDAEELGLVAPTSELSVARHAGTWRIHVEDTSRIGPIALRLRWSEACQSLLSIPRPAAGARFLRGRAEVLASSTVVTPEQLAGVCVEVLGAPSSEYNVVVRTVANDQPSDEAVVPMEEVAPGFYRQDLVRVHAMLALRLAMSMDLDAKIHLRVRGPGQAMLAGLLQVGRYVAELVPEGDEVLLHGANLAAFSAPNAAPVVDVRPLWRPAAPPEPLPEVAPGRWRFDRRGREPGPWLLVGWSGAWCLARPLLISVAEARRETEGAEGPERSSFVGTSQLERIVGLVDRRERADEFALLLHTLASDPSNPEWNRVRDYVATLGVLPATTFDLLDALIEVPQACVVALLLAGTTGFDRTWTGLEELPFAWDAVPQKAWRDALGHLVNAAINRPEVDAAMLRDALALRVAGFRRQVITRLPAATVAIDLAAEHLGLSLPMDRANPSCAGFVRSPELAERVGLGQLATASQDLWRLHANDEWPQWSEIISLREKFLSQMPSWLHELAPLPPEGAGYRVAVEIAPRLAALAAVWSMPLNRKEISGLRRMRDYDPRWYLAAHTATTLVAVGRGLHHAPERFQ